MRTLILLLILFTPSLWASSDDIPENLYHQIQVKPLDGLPHYPSLTLDNLPVLNTREYTDGWQHPLDNINQISALIADDSGYYIAGTTLHSEDINVQFNRHEIDDLLGSPSYIASTDKELFSTSTNKKIAVSLFHLNRQGELLWVNRLENDIVSSGPMVRLPDGRTLLAMTPLMLDEENGFSSFLFFISADGQTLQRHELPNTLINSLLLTSQGNILAGVVRREASEDSSSTTLRQYAYILNADGTLQNELLLANHPGGNLVYKVLSLSKEYEDSFVLSGGDSVFIIDKGEKPLERFFLHPTLDQYADYYINTFYRDNDKNLLIQGFYGREKSLLAEIKVNYLQSVTRPTNPVDELTPSYQRMLDNPLLRGIYNDMLSDMRHQIRERSTPFNAVLTHDRELINLVDLVEESTQHVYTGSVSENGLRLIERIYNGEQQYYLLDKDSHLLIRGQMPTSFCQHLCLLHDNTLMSLQWDDERGYVLHQGEFTPTAVDTAETSNH